MRLEINQVAGKTCKYMLILYTILCVIYTGHYFYVSYAGAHHDIYPRARDPNELTAQLQQEPIHHPAPEQAFEEHTVAWSNAQGTVHPISEEFVMSKVFANAMGPNNMIPFFYRAKTQFDQEDITMATLVTRNRFPVLARLASNYKGPISAAVHVNDDETKEDVLKELRELYAENPAMGEYVDLHLIIDNYDRQFNMWRNIAKLFARTDYIMMLDVDFHICTDLRQSIRSNAQVMDMLRSGRTALVVPAFEFIAQADGEDWRTFPTNKDDMLHLVQDKKLDMFHRGWQKGHGSTNYTRWYESDDVYKVTKYDFSYEPYIIYKKEGSPWCDERFIGYGANKAACLYEIFLSGIEYWVLPDDFLIHQTHRYPEDTRRKERQYNRKLYSNFREEVCLRYARKFYASGDWETSRADNLKSECQRIRGFRSTMMTSNSD